MAIIIDKNVRRPKPMSDFVKRLRPSFLHFKLTRENNNLRMLWKARVIIVDCPNLSEQLVSREVDIRNFLLKKIDLCTNMFVPEDCLFVDSEFEPLTRDGKFPSRVNRLRKSPW